MSLRHDLVLGTALALVTAVPGFADGLDARLSASRVAEGDQVVLTLTADAAAAAGQPDLTVLDKDFTVLGTASGSQTTIINGARSDRVSWQVTLAPKHKGQITIPAISAGGVSSAPVALTVLDAADLPAAVQAGRPTVTVTGPDGSVYLHEEVPITVQARLPAGTQGAEIVAPTSPDYLLEQSGDDRVTRQPDGSVLVERSYLMRSQHEGPVTVDGVTVTAEIADQNAPDPVNAFGQSPFAGGILEDFFSGGVFGQSGGPFGRGGFPGMFAPTRTVSVTGDPLRLSVLPTPTGASGWALPARNVELREIWQPDPPVFRAGEAVTRKVQVLALGAHGEQIPDLEMPDIPGAKVYFEGAVQKSMPTDRGTVALREFTWSIVPTAGGTITLPELAVDWFDTVNEAEARATLAAESYDVDGPVAAAPAPKAPASTAAPVAAAATRPVIADRWLTAGLVAGALVLIVGVSALVAMLTRARRRRAAAPAGPKPVTAAQAAAAQRRDALVRVRHAARLSDGPGAQRAALDWIRAAGMTADTVAIRFPDFGRAFHDLETTLYGSDSPAPDLRTLAATMRAADRAFNATETRRSALPPLYPATS